MAVPLTARVPIDFTPPALIDRNAGIVAENAERAKRDEPPLDPIKLIVRVPTMYERDAFSAALVRGGVVHYTRAQIRDLMLAGLSFLYPETEFDRLRQDLEDLWQAGDAMQACEQRRANRLVELIEQHNAAVQANPKKKPMTDTDVAREIEKIKPEHVIPDQRRVKVTAIQQDLASRYEPLQKAFADLAEQEIKRRWLCAEIYIVNWKGLEHFPDGNGRGGITRAEAEYLRGAIGGIAFDQVADFIFAMHSIDGDEEKNLASLIESASAPTGSTASESKGENEPGNSTGEPSTPTPGDGSQKTTGSSSSSTKRAGTRTGRSKSGRTDAPSSTSPSS